MSTTKTRTLATRLPAIEAVKIARAAKTAGVSVSDYLRSAADEKIERVRTAEAVAEKVREAVAEIRAQAVSLAREASERETAQAAWVKAFLTSLDPEVSSA